MKEEKVVTCPVCKTKLKVTVEAVKERRFGLDAVRVTGSLEDFKPFSVSIPDVNNINTLISFNVKEGVKVFSNGAIAFFSSDSMPWPINEINETNTNKSAFAAKMVESTANCQHLPPIFLLDSNEDFVRMVHEYNRSGERGHKLVDRCFVDVSMFLCEMVIGDKATFKSSTDAHSPIFCFCKGKLVTMFMPVVVRKTEGEHGKET